MNVASPELCKKLYELSGWETGTTGFSYDEGHLMFGYIEGRDYPAYDLGYLLRKLAPLGSINLSVISGQYCATVGSPYTVLLETPEDAVCKLCIMLFESGYLKHD